MATIITYKGEEITVPKGRTISLDFADATMEDNLLIKFGTPTFDVVSFATGTDAQILRMIQLDHDGEIDLRDYWNVGDTREVQLSAIPDIGTGYTVGESHEAQTIELVIMDSTCKGFTLVDQNREPHFIVGQKNCLNNAGFINSTATNTGGWSECDRRSWCNIAYKAALPSTIQQWFGKFKWKQGVGGGATSGLNETEDYFALTPAQAVFGSIQHFAQTDEDALYDNWTWYQTASNRIKQMGEYGRIWWECSPYPYSYTGFGISTSGSANYQPAASTYGISPFGCI